MLIVVAFLFGLLSGIALIVGWAGLDLLFSSNTLSPEKGTGFVMAWTVALMGFAVVAHVIWD